MIYLKFSIFGTKGRNLTSITVSKTLTCNFALKDQYYNVTWQIEIKATKMKSDYIIG